MKRDSNVSITQTQLIKKYNLGMGGVNVMDPLLGSYRLTISGKKWHWPLVFNAIEIYIVAAWWGEEFHIYQMVSGLMELGISKHRQHEVVDHP